MPCYVPFDDKSLDLCFAILKPVGLFTDELIETMKCFSYHAESLGCVYCSIFNSIHGNLVIWYGAWIKRSNENREILTSTLLSCLAELSKQAVIVNHGFFKPYGGESKEEGELRKRAKLSRGDTVFILGMTPISNDPSDLSYACLALLRSYFSKTGGISSAVCFRQQQEPTRGNDSRTSNSNGMVAMMQVWKSLEECYSWLIHSDHRNTIRPFISHLSDDIRYDVCKVVFVSSDEVVDLRFCPLPLQPNTTVNAIAETDKDENKIV